MERRDMIYLCVVLAGMGVLISVGIGFMILDLSVKKACQNVWHGKSSPK